MLNPLVTVLGHFPPRIGRMGPRGMDSYCEHQSDFDAPGAVDTSAADDVAAAIGTDERRMHVRAYNYWVSLLNGRDFPSIEDLEPGDVQDFAAHSVLLDFTCGHQNPGIPYIGGGIREECGLDEDMRSIDSVPSRSLLSRLTDHYMQIIANRAPVGFEAEFVNQRGHNTLYRGILMPLSSDGESIDFIYGVINWKEMADADTASVLATQVEAAVAAAPSPPAALGADALVWADGPNADFVETVTLPEAPVHDATLSLWPDAPGLADRLSAARFCAEEAADADQRSRHALYR